MAGKIGKRKGIKKDGVCTTFYVTKQMKRKLRMESASADISISEYLRRLVEECLQKQKSPE